MTLHVMACFGGIFFLLMWEAGVVEIVFTSVGMCLRIASEQTLRSESSRKGAKTKETRDKQS